MKKMARPYGQAIPALAKKPDLAQAGAWPGPILRGIQAQRTSRQVQQVSGQAEQASSQIRGASGGRAQQASGPAQRTSCQVQWPSGEAEQASGLEGRRPPPWFPGQGSRQTPSQPTPWWLALLCCALLVAWLWPPRADANGTALGGPTFEAQRADIEKRLTTAQTELEAARAEHDASSGQAQSRTDDLTNHLKARQAFVEIYQTQLDELSKLQDLTSRAEVAARELKDWQPPAGDPPWPLASGDAALLALYQAEATAERLAAVIDRSQLRLADARKERDMAESRYRAAEEKSQAAGKASASRPGDQDLVLPRLELDLYNEITYWMDLEHQSLIQERRLNEIEMERLHKTLGHFDGRFSLTEAALADKTHAIEDKLERLRLLEVQAMAEVAAAQGAVEAAKGRHADAVKLAKSIDLPKPTARADAAKPTAAVESAEPAKLAAAAGSPESAKPAETVKSAGPAKSPEAAQLSAAAKSDEPAKLADTNEPSAEPSGHPPRKTAPKAGPDQEIAIARANLERLQSRLDLYRKVLIPLHELLRSLWEQRAALYGKTRPDHADMLKIDSEIHKIQYRIDLYRGDAEQVIDSNSQLAAELREELAAGPAEPEEALLLARLAAANGKAEDAREAIDELMRVSMTMRMVTGEIDRMYRSGSVLQWLRNAWVTTWIWAKAVWDFELMWVDETIKIEGREVKTTRSVTVGKSIGAVAILIGGYLLISWSIRRVLALGVAWLGLPASRAAILGGWLRLGALATLILISFNLVDIPLQIFAFLGGALVLGIGFGAQTLLKNLISGVMLLTERPVRVGDLVEVDNIRGHITSIGIRVSTIFTSQGMAMHIPNSTLVEQRLINWTYSDPEVRYELHLGVAYGSDVERVKTILIEVAQAHPEVLAQPAPTVLLADFADNALVFTLRFWLRIPTGGNERNATVSSDLRFGILAALNQAGIEIPYPQRNLRVIQDSPLEVRMTA